MNVFQEKKIDLHFRDRGMALTAAFPIGYFVDLSCENVFEIANAKCLEPSVARLFSYTIWNKPNEPIAVFGGY